MLKICIALIDFYQVFLSFDSGLLRILAPGGACKFSPSCSEYTKLAIKEYGVLKGISQGIGRLVQCR